jgi:hypothetical protein
MTRIAMKSSAKNRQTWIAPFNVYADISPSSQTMSRTVIEISNMTTGPNDHAVAASAAAGAELGFKVLRPVSTHGVAS